MLCNKSQAMLQATGTQSSWDPSEDHRTFEILRESSKSRMGRPGHCPQTRLSLVEGHSWGRPLSLSYFKGVPG
jgi:hypothetical protein